MGVIRDGVDLPVGWGKWDLSGLHDVVWSCPMDETLHITGHSKIYIANILLSLSCGLSLLSTVDNK